MADTSAKFEVLLTEGAERRWCNKMSSIPAAPDFLTV